MSPDSFLKKIKLLFRKIIEVRAPMWIIPIGTILIIVYMQYNVPDFYLQAQPELLATFLGAINGYVIAVYVELKMREYDTQRVKKDLVDSLLIEIKENNSILNKGLEIRSFDSTQVRSFWNTLMLTNYESMLYSGQYINISPHLKLQITYYYNAVKNLNEAIEKQFNELNAGYNETSTISNVTNLYNILIKMTPDIIIKLEEEIK